MFLDICPLPGCGDLIAPSPIRNVIQAGLNGERRLCCSIEFSQCRSSLRWLHHDDSPFCRITARFDCVAASPMITTVRESHWLTRVVVTGMTNWLAAGIRFVAVHFDGYGDDGTTEDVKCYSGDTYTWGEHEPIDYDVSRLQEHFEFLCRSAMRTIAADSEMSSSTWPPAN